MDNKVAIRALEIVVGTNDWQLGIKKYNYESEPRIYFSGNPTMEGFKKAFEVLASIEIGTQLKELVEKIQQQIV